MGLKERGENVWMGREWTQTRERVDISGERAWSKRVDRAATSPRSDESTENKSSLLGMVGSGHSPAHRQFSFPPPRTDELRPEASSCPHPCIPKYSAMVPSTPCTRRPGALFGRGLRATSERTAGLRACVATKAPPGGPDPRRGGEGFRPGVKQRSCGSAGGAGAPLAAPTLDQPAIRPSHSDCGGYLRART